MKTNTLFVLMLWLIAWFAPPLAAQEAIMQMEPRMDKTNPTDATLTTFPFYDNVEDSLQSSSWWTYAPTQWRISKLGSHGGVRSWECFSPTNYNYLTIASPLNLSSATNPVLSFWAFKNGTWLSNFYIQVSIDGGTSWTQIIYQSFNATSPWTRYQISLQNYQTYNVLIRFGVNQGSGSFFLFDNITIDNAPTPGNAALSLPGNNGMKVSWSQSTASDFGKYRIVFSTEQSTVNDWNYAVGNTVTGRSETRVIDIPAKTTLQYVFADLTFVNQQYWVKVYEQDTLELFNQGTNLYDLYTTFTVTPQTAPFVQTFEGTYKWAADAPWAVTSADSVLPGHSPKHAYEDSPGGNYPANADRWLVMQANCNTMAHPVLKFNHSYSFNQTDGDYGEIAYSLDNSNWWPMGWFSGYNLDNFQPEEFDLSQLHGQSPVYLRYRTYGSATGNYDGWHLDDVQIVNRSFANTFPFTDNVEDSLLTHQKWVKGNWKMTGTAHSSLWAWQCKPIVDNQFSYLTFSGPVSLSASTNPTLLLWVKTQNAGFFVQPEVSLDNGTNWTALQYVVEPSNSNWVSYQWSLADYMQSDVLIRIGVSKYYAVSNAICNIDDILIDNAPTPGSFTLTNPTNNGMKANWQASTATDFSKYRLIISTSSSETDTWDKTVGTTFSGRSETRVIDIFDKNTALMTFTDQVFTNTRYFAKLYVMDTQNLWNQGTEVAELFTAFNVTVQTAPFVQNFEGTVQWAADMPWSITKADSVFPGHSLTHGYEDSPNGLYPANSDRWLVMQTNCYALTHPVLKFKHRYSFESSYDYGELAYSTDNENWTSLGRFAGNMLTSYLQEEFDLSFLRGSSQIYFKFRTYSNLSEQRDGWLLDDVEIYNNTRTTPFPFYDDVENDSIAHLNWLQGMWRTAAGGHSGNTSWKYANQGEDIILNEYMFITLAGPINLSSTSNPELSFWYRLSTPLYNYITQVSTDAGFTWSTISSAQISGSTWQKMIVSLSSYKLPSVMLRIGLKPYYTLSYPIQTYIDDIMINEALTAPVLVTPANAGVNVAMPVSFDWNNTPGAAKYYLQVATANTFTPAQIVFRDSTITTSAKTVSSLVSGNTYYWRVLAINMIEERGAWSGIWSFSTGASTSDVFALNAGWNLISFDVSVNPDSTHLVFAPLIAANNLVTVTGFQDQQGVYYLPPPAPGIMNTLKTLANDEGYWVKVVNATNLTVLGQDIPNNFTIQLTTGWNLVSWPWGNTTPAAAFTNLNPQGALLMVTGFEIEGYYYDPLNPDFSTLGQVKNGLGYWVKVSANCTLTFQ